MVETSVDLGYLEDREEWLLTNKFFPSKVGGRPAWLELRDIPSPLELQCEKCQEPLAFLCQIYASNDQVPEAFHRTIYVFICRNTDCCVDNSSENLLILRNQLPRQNEFYSFEPSDEEVQSDPVRTPVNLCRACGCRGPHACSRCKTVTYCGIVHQRADWKQRHKNECASKVKTPGASAIVFPEKELVIEAEELEQTLVTETGAEAEARRLKDYEALLKSGKAGLADIPDAEIEKYVAEEKEDKSFSKFRERIKQNADQVIRYDRGGAPLWITDENQLKDEDVPKCPKCEQPRSFEFQIMPQLLNSLGTDNLDWGVIAVYTCSKDCDISSKYVREFAFKQDLTKE